MKNKFPILFFLLSLVVCIPVILADSEVQNNQDGTRKIAFVSKRDGNSEIYTINEDGSGLNRLTNNKSEDTMPQWSPDGTKIFYISKNGNKNEIWVINFDGSDPVRVAEECDMDYPPSWSPDSQKILFSVRPSLRQNRIYTVNANGENLICISEGETRGKYPSWSPDGSKILFMQEYQKEMAIYTMNPDGTNPERLTREEGVYESPAWSPDGTKIAFIFTKKSFIEAPPVLCVINADGSGRKELTKTDYDLLWSPDGSLIAFTKVADKKINYRPGHNPEIIKYYGVFTIRADGNGYETKAGMTGEERSFPAWALDSSKLLYTVESKLNIYNLRNRNTTKVNIDKALATPRVSPDGAKILWVGGKAGMLKKSNLYTAKADGTAIKKLTDSNADFDPVWQPVVNQ